MDRTFAANVDVLQVLQSRTVRGIMIPYRQLEQESPKRQLNLMRPIFA